MDLVDLYDAPNPDELEPFPEWTGDDGPEPEPEGWTVDDDTSAEWALRQLGRAKAELAALDDHARAETDRVKAWRAAAGSDAERRAAVMESHLNGYARRLRDRGVATRKLVAGEVGTRKTPDKVEVVDEAAFVEFVRRVERFDLVEFSARALLVPLRKAVEPVAPGSWFAVESGLIIAPKVLELIDETLDPTPDNVARLLDEDGVLHDRADVHPCPLDAVAVTLGDDAYLVPGVGFRVGDFRPRAVPAAMVDSDTLTTNPED